jgi:6-pyruvoyltetrahydropterin/6-carboxytetrahydropterin synthase
MSSHEISCTRRLSWCSGHRVYRHESKCANVHGHEYLAEITAAPNNGLDSVGRVVDFSVLKEKIGGWIDQHWDHGMLLFSDDPIGELWISGPLKEHKHFFLPYNPTAENLCHFLGANMAPHLLKGLNLQVAEVTIWETPNCRATWKSIF